MLEKMKTCTKVYLKKNKKENKKRRKKKKRRIKACRLEDENKNKKEISKVGKIREGEGKKRF